MALVSSALQALIIAKFKTFDGSVPGAAASVLTDWAGIVAGYIQANADLEFSWVATMPPPASTPDPMVTASGKIISLSFPLVPTGLTDVTLAQSTFKAMMVGGMSIAPITITTIAVPPFTVAGTMALGAGLTGFNLELALMGCTTPEAAIAATCDEIIRWVKSLTMAMVNGIRGPYTIGGVGLVTTIN